MKQKPLLVLLGLACIVAAAYWFMRSGDSSEVVIEGDPQAIEVRRQLNELVNREQSQSGELGGLVSPPESGSQ